MLLTFSTVSQDHVTEDHADGRHVTKNTHVEEDHIRVPIGSVRFGFRLNRYRTDFSVIGSVNLPKFRFRFRLKPIPIGIYRKPNRFTDKF